MLDSFLVDITLPPALVLTLRDTTPAQNPDIWLSAIPYLEQKTLVQEIDTVLEGFRTKALTLLPPFLLGLIRPLRSTSKGLSTNLAVLQTSLLLKYQPFFAFLNRRSPKLAKQVERGYVNAARAYYETGIRRYARALGTIKAVEKVNRESALETSEYDRLQYADLVEGEVVLAYMADDKELVSGRHLTLLKAGSAPGSTVSVSWTGPGRQCFSRVYLYCPVLCRFSFRRRSTHMARSL